MDAVATWQARPLEATYPIVFFDALRVRTRRFRPASSTSSLDFTSCRDRKPVAVALKDIYRATDADAAEKALAAFEDLLDVRRARRGKFEASAS